MDCTRHPISKRGSARAGALQQFAVSALLACASPLFASSVLAQGAIQGTPPSQITPQQATAGAAPSQESKGAPQQAREIPKGEAANDGDQVKTNGDQGKNADQRKDGDQGNGNRTPGAIDLRALGFVLGFAAVGVLAWGVLMLVNAMIATINHRGDTIAVYSNWSGFGGGLTGWSLSRSFSLLLAALVVGSLTVWLATVVAKAIPSVPASPPEGASSNTADSASKDDSGAAGTAATADRGAGGRQTDSKADEKGAAATATSDDDKNDDKKSP